MMFAVKTSGLTKVYSPPGRIRRAVMRSPLRERITAVDHVDLQIEPGEVFGVLGPNGAGKTTLFKMLTTLLVPTEGNAIVAGYDVLKDGSGVRRSIGLVTGEERSFQWRMTGRQNLSFFAALAGVPRREVDAKVDYLMSLMRLSDAADNMFYSYSSGMKQKMCIARALLGEPSVLFLDEPTKTVDTITAVALKRLIRNELSGSSGRTVVLATHRMEEAEELCDRIAILRKGRVVFCGTVPELRAAAGGSQECVIRLQGVDLQQAREIAHRNALRGFLAERPSGNGSIQMRFATDEDGADLTRVLRDLMTQGASVLACTQRDRTLEDLFLDVVREEDS